MVTIRKMIGAMSCGWVLGLILSNAAIPAVVAGSDCAEQQGDPPNRVKCEAEMRQDIETVRGDVLRVEGENFLVERADGKEVRMHFDESTQMFGYVGPGERVEAKINNEGYALSIRLVE